MGPMYLSVENIYVLSWKSSRMRNCAMGRGSIWLPFVQPLLKIYLLREFSVDGGELGPSLKLKRFHVAEKYRETINEMYQ